MARRSKTNLWQQLVAKHKEFEGDDVILGKEMLGFPRKTDAARGQMYTHHIDQRLNLGGKNVRPDKPKVFTNYEDMVGDRSSYIHRAKEDCVVNRIIQKFPSEEGTLRAPMMVFLHYTKSDEYDAMYITDVENMSEKYGFENDNEKVLSISEGHEFKEGEVINSPKCYDEFGNYGFGKNYKTMQMISTNIIEDGIEVSTEIAEDVTSKNYFGSTEVYYVKVPINDNVILINSYGENGEYKSFPYVGEHTKDNQVCTKRIVTSSQILYDLKTSNIKRRLPSDSPVYVNGEVTDIDLYCNKLRSELQDRVFDRQLIDLYDQLIRYNTEIVEYVREIVQSGGKITKRLKRFYKNARDYIDDDYKYKDDNDRVFSKMSMYFTIKKNVGLLKGQKMTGRHGNKGVITKITPTCLMPHLETGEVVHVKVNGLGPVNRLTTMPLMEVSITFVTNRAVEYIRDKPMKTKEKVFFRVLEIFAPTEYKAVKDAYMESCKTKEDKEFYFKIVDEHGIYVYQPPYWTTVNTYDALCQCYDEFEWLRPYTVFFYEPHTKRWVPMIQPQFIGDMYMLKLMHTSKKGLSARSTGTINRRGVPDKTENAKKFQVPYSNIPIRRGKQEMANDAMALDPELIAKEQLAHRSSPIARKYLATKLMENYLGVEKFDPTEEMKNINVEILSAYMLILGMELEFDHDEIDLSDEPGIKSHRYNGKKYYCTTDQMREIVARDIAEVRVKERRPGAIYWGPELSQGDFMNELVQRIKDDLLTYV